MRTEKAIIFPGRGGSLLYDKYQASSRVKHFSKILISDLTHFEKRSKFGQRTTLTENALVTSFLNQSSIFQLILSD